MHVSYTGFITAAKKNTLKGLDNWFLDQVMSVWHEKQLQIGD